MQPVILQIVLSGEQALPLWAHATWSGKLTSAAWTVQRLAQRAAEWEADKAREFFAACPECLQNAENAYSVAHAGMPAGDKPPESVIVVNLPPIVPALPPNSPSGTVSTAESPTLQPVADDEL